MESTNDKQMLKADLLLHWNNKESLEVLVDDSDRTELVLYVFSDLFKDWNDESRSTYIMKLLEKAAEVNPLSPALFVKFVFCMTAQELTKVIKDSFDLDNLEGNG